MRMLFVTRREIVNLGRDPSWSPDGTRIAFIRWASGGLQIWTVSPDGSSEKMLTQGDHEHMYPTWSPDGHQMAFEYDHAHVAVMDAGGGPPRIIADKGSYNLSWSPDGSKIVFAPSQEGLAGQRRWQRPGTDRSGRQATVLAGCAVATAWSSCA